MVVIVWAGWKGRAGQLWAWIYTAVTDCRDRISRAKNRAVCIRRSKKLAGACAFACTRARIYPGWAGTMTAFTMLTDAMEATARRAPLISPPSAPPLLVRTDVLLSHRLQRVYNNRPSWFSSHHIRCFDRVLRGWFARWLVGVRIVGRIFRMDRKSCLLQYWTSFISNVKYFCKIIFHFLSLF